MARAKAMTAPRKKRSDGGTFSFFLSLLCFLAIWELLPRLGLISGRLFPPVSEVLMRLLGDLRAGELLPHVRSSATEFAIGYLGASAVGVPLGLLLGSIPVLDVAVSPYILSLYAMPSQAWFPLLIIWFGIGRTSRIILIGFFVLFAVVLNTRAGVRGVDPSLRKVGQVFGATSGETLLKITLPSALPSIVVGLRLGVGRGVIGVFLAELVGTFQGIGFYVFRAGTEFQLDRVFAGLIVLVGLSLVVTEGVRMLEERLQHWRPRPS